MEIFVIYVVNVNLKNVKITFLGCLKVIVLKNDLMLILKKVEFVLQIKNVMEICIVIVGI